jgi:glycyl-tRNA synthetase beta chain
MESLEKHPLTDRLIDLYRTSLMTEMVNEFPELQYKMGTIYTRAQGGPEELCKAMEECWQPAYSNDDLPTTDLAAQVSLLDKIDHIVGFIGVGEAPTSSKDPYAIRRAAIAVIRLLMQERFKSANLIYLIKTTIKTYDNIIVHHEKTFNEVFDFIKQRLKVYLYDLYPEKRECISELLSNYFKDESYFNIYELKEKIDELVKEI